MIDNVFNLRIAPVTPIDATSIASMLEMVDDVRARVAKGEIASVAIATVELEGHGIGGCFNSAGFGASWALVASMRRLIRRIDIWAFD